MTTGLERQPIQQRDPHLKSTFWMAATFVVALALSGAQAVAQRFGYVTNLDDGTVSVINPATNTAVATISVGSGPSSIAVTPDGAHVYVLNALDNTVSVIATATNTVVGSPIPVGPTLNPPFILPGGIAINPSGSRVYVVNNVDNSVSVIATATNKVVGSPIPVGSSPTGIAITPDGAHVYVSNLLDGTVSLIATATNTVVDTFPVGTPGSSLPAGLAITPDGSHVYVAIFAGSEVDVIATATNMVVATIPVSSELCNSGPWAIAITPDGTHAYVLHASSGTPPDCPVQGTPEESVLVIDTATNTLVGSPITVSTGGAIITYTIGITPDGTGVYVPVPVTTNLNVPNNTVAVISTASNTETATVTVGNGPDGVAFTPAIFFSAFSTKLDISSAGFDLNGTFTLGATGSINPPAQPLTLQVGTYTVTVPAGSFKAGPHGTFTFEGTIGGVALQIRIAPLKAGTYSIQADASGVNLTGLTNPVAVTLSIGINTGTTSVTGQSN